jgi:hypothetical protein
MMGSGKVRSDDATIVTGTIVAWNIADALVKVVNALFALERKKTDPDVLRDLAGASIEVGKDLETVLGLIAEKIKD